jgi:hypothetical protein
VEVPAVPTKGDENMIENTSPKPERRNGRPSKYTAPVIRRILKSVERGLPFAHVIAKCGCSYQSFLNYRRDHPRFEEALQRAVAKGIDKRLAVVEDCLSNSDPNVRLRSAIWYLEHCPGASEHFSSRTRVEAIAAIDTGFAIPTNLLEEIAAARARRNGQLGNGGPPAVKDKVVEVEETT